MYVVKYVVKKNYKQLYSLKIDCMFFRMQQLIIYSIVTNKYCIEIL